MSSVDGALADAAATAMCAFLSRALVASRANRSWSDLGTLGGHVAAASPALHAGLGPAIKVDPASGLLPWETWARLKADQRVALDERAHSRARGNPSARRRYHDALRALPVPRLGDVEHALRSQDKTGRRLHVVLDKVEAGGALVRLAADVTVARSLDDRRLSELLFPMTSFAVELILVRLLAAKGVVDVERVTRGAVDLCSCPHANVRSPALAALVHEGGSVCALAFSTCATDVAAGDNDLLPHESTPLADLARAHLGSAARALPHRVYRDRKLVVTQGAMGAVTACAHRAGTHTVVYRVEGA